MVRLIEVQGHELWPGEIVSIHTSESIGLVGRSKLVYICSRVDVRG